MGLSLQTIPIWWKPVSSTPNVTNLRISLQTEVECFFCQHTLKLTIAGVQNISRQLSVHPIHLRPDSDGNLPPSALIPFCAYQDEDSLLGEERPELRNLTLCDMFEPTILEGQRCYSLDVAKLKPESTETGKKGALYLLLDPNPYPTKSTDVKIKRNDQESFKVYIHTLAENTAFGPGAYAMHTLKKMTGKPSFYQMRDSQKECQVYSREKCQTEMILKDVKTNCSCFPWALITEDLVNCPTRQSLLLFIGSLH